MTTQRGLTRWSTPSRLPTRYLDIQKCFGRYDHDGEDDADDDDDDEDDDDDGDDMMMTMMMLVITMIGWWRMLMIGSSLITICPGPEEAAMES